MDTLTRDTLDKTLSLAYLEIEESKKDAFLNDMQNTLNFVDQIDQLPLAHVSPSAYAFEQEQTLREDILTALDDHHLEKNAPQWEGHSFSVPKILDETVS